MSPDRFIDCLSVIGWTPTNLASRLHCDVSWVEAIETGAIEVPAGLAAWLETLAQVHEGLPPPKSYRGKRINL